jgi:signal transduction histidine kinase
VVLGLFFGLGLLARTEATQEVSVLFLEQDDPGRPAYINLMRAFRSVLEEEWVTRPTLYTENIDSARFHSPEYRLECSKWLRRKYHEKRIQVIIAAGGTSLELAQQLQRDHWPEASIILVTSDFGKTAPSALSNIHVFRVKMDVLGTFKVARKLMPESGKLVLIQGMTSAYPELDAYVRTSIRDAAKEQSIEFEEMIGLTVRETALRLSRLEPDTVVFYGAISVDGSGTSYIPRDVLSDLSEVSAAPIFGMTDTFIGHGIVAGSCLCMGNVGRELARLTARVIAGSEGSDPVGQPELHQTLFDWNQLKKHRLNGRPLPAGSVLLHKPPSLWETHRPTVLWGGSAILAQSFLMVLLMVQRSRRQTAEREVALQRDHLAHAGRVSVMGQLASSMAHELNQPLGAMILNAETAARMLGQPSPDLDELRAILSDICSDNRRAVTVIERMRALLKKQSLSMAPLDVRELVEEVLRLMKFNIAARDVTVEFETGHAVPEVMGDWVQMQQVLINLIINAMDAQKEHSNRWVKISLGVEAKGWVAIRVGDHGPGISEEQTVRLFEPFYTTKEDGLGMGLSICRTIVESHGGFIETENPPEGRGVVFIVRFPAYDRIQ